MKTAIIITMLAVSFLGAWEKIWDYGDRETIKNIIQVNDGDFILSAKDYSIYSENKAFVMRVDSTGELIWRNRYDGSDSIDGLETTVMLNDSTIILGGYTWDYHSPYSKMWLFSINTDGDTLWTYEEDEGLNYSARSIDITRDEHIIMLMSDWHIGKYTLDREREWKYRFPIDWDINQTEKVITVQGHEPPGYAFVGFTSSGSTSDIYFIRYNEYDHEHNDTSWIRYYGACEGNWAYDIIEITDPAPGLPKGFLLVGANKNAVCCTSLCYAVRIDTVGDTVWTKEYSHPLYEWTGLSHGQQQIKTVTWAGNEPYQTKFMLGAYIAYPESLGAKYVTWLLAISDTLRGDTLWTATYDSYFEQFAGDIISCDDGGYVIVGSVKESSSSGSDLWLLRVDSLGNDIPTAISEYERKPNIISLSAFPNPFNSSVAIEIHIPNDDELELNIFNISGQLVREIYSGTIQQGTHQFVWDGRDGVGHIVPSGLYYCKSSASSASSVSKLVLLK